MTLTFGGLKKAAPAKAKEEKPPLPDPTGELTALLAEGITAAQNEKAWAAANEGNKARFAAAGIEHLFNSSAGVKGEIEDTFKLKSAAGAITVSLTNKYKLPKDVAEVRQLLGEHADTYLHKGYVIQVDCDSIPTDMQQQFVDRLVALARELDAEHAMFNGTEQVEGEGPVLNAITVKESVSVDKRFHHERHSVFTPEVNNKIHQLMPFVASCRYDY